MKTKHKVAAGLTAGTLGAAALFIGPFEGFYPKAYLDPIGVPTVCYGETEGVKLGDHLSLSQTPSGWRLIENRAMLLLDVRFVQTDLWNGDRPAAVTSCA